MFEFRSDNTRYDATVDNKTNKNMQGGLYGSGGGACNNNLASSNQYKTMMNKMGMGSENPERLMQMQRSGKDF